jgi:hypothetical protein
MLHLFSGNLSISIYRLIYFVSFGEFQFGFYWVDNRLFFCFFVDTVADSQLLL